MPPTKPTNDDYDLITDFEVGVGKDILHIGNIIEGFSGASDIDDFLRIVLDSGQTKLQMDVDGEANGVNFVTLAVMTGISSGLSVDTLYANGQIDTQPVTRLERRSNAWARVTRLLASDRPRRSAPLPARIASADDRAAGVGQLADQPVRLQRIAEPGLGPALIDAAAHRALADSLAPFIEQRQLAAGLTDAPAQPLALLRGRPVLAVEVEDERFLKHSQIPVCYVVEFRIYSWLMRRQEACWQPSLSRHLRVILFIK